MQRLYDAGIISQVHYIPVPLHPYYQKRGHRPEDFPNAWSYYTEALSIPLYFALTDTQQDQVIQTVQSALH